LRENAARAGRKFDSISLSVFGIGPREEDARKFIDLGFSRIVFTLPPVVRDKILPRLDRYAALAGKLG